jgi:hypothetical protein
MLWTTQFDAAGRLKNNDYYFFGGHAVHELTTWNRYRFGWPLTVVTFDTSQIHHAWSIRLEKKEFYLQTLGTYLVSLIIFIFYRFKNKHATSTFKSNS